MDIVPEGNDAHYPGWCRTKWMDAVTQILAFDELSKPPAADVRCLVNAFALGFNLFVCADGGIVST